MDRITTGHRVRIEMPDPLPVSDEELSLIETHMGAIIAAMLDTAAPELPRQTD